MASPIFIDANVPQYASGRPHPLRQPCLDTLALVAVRPGAFRTDAEVLQEILHRYLAIHAWPRGRIVLRGFANLMLGRVEPVSAADVGLAAALADRYTALSARDLIHLAVMQRLGMDQIITADRGFDAVEGITRLDPADLDTWRNRIGQ